jgi:tetratricopeptide (TPR) repeat protein
MKRLIILFVFAFLTNVTFAQINYQKDSLQVVFAKAKSENKILMVDVFTDWCKWCIELDNKVYSNPEVYNFANAHQVNYKIDAEKGEGIEFAKKYKVTGYPTVLFLDGNGNEVDRIIGYYPEKEFFANMKDYNAGKNTFADLKKRLEKDPNDIPATLSMAEKQMALGNNDEAKKLLNKIIEIDPQDLSGKADKAKYDLASLSDSAHIINDLETFIKENPTSPSLKDAYVSMAETYYYSRNDEVNADETYKKAFALFPNDDGLNSSFGQYLNSKAVNLADKGTSSSDYQNGLSLIEQALPYLKGTVNEGSSYYIQSKLYYNLKQYDNALGSIDKAIKIFNRKLYRDMKEKIEKSMSMK